MLDGSERPNGPDLDVIDRARGCLLGLATGDALGTTVEFAPRGSFEPLTDMVGGGPFGLRAGEWTDDTSMALCLGESLRERGFDPADQMDRYTRWLGGGYMSSTSRCVDAGRTTRNAIARFVEIGQPFAGSIDEDSAGNGSLMRLAPVPIWASPDEEFARRLARESSRTTHGAPECLSACELLAMILVRLLAGEDRDAAFRVEDFHTTSPRIRAIAAGTWRHKDAREISSSGYVVHSLEAALWCFERTDSFRECVLQAANLGDDAGTTAAIAGQLAGAFYGEAGIPAEWRERLHLAEFIGEMAEDLARARPAALRT